MNHQLAPQEPFSKDECLQQFQNLRKNKPSQKVVPSARVQTITGNSESEEMKDNAQQIIGSWSNEQQKQLEVGLATYPVSSGLSSAERWKAIAAMVEVIELRFLF